MLVLLTTQGLTAFPTLHTHLVRLDMPFTSLKTLCVIITAKHFMHSPESSVASLLIKHTNEALLRSNRHVTQACVPTCTSFIYAL